MSEDERNEEISTSEVSFDDSSGLSDSSIQRQLHQFWGRSSDASDEDNKASDRFGRYQLYEVLGYGSFGVVYRGIDVETNAIVAVKLARPEVLLDTGKRDRFVSEATAAERLSHPYIVRVIDAELEGPIPYIVSEYCEGPDLAAWISTRDVTSFSVAVTLDFIKKIVEAIGYAHSVGIVHRDIKPSNILVAKLPTQEIVEQPSFENLIPRLTDFGLAKVYDGPLLDSRSSVVLGTPMYMAPEQMLSKWGPVSQRTDIFAIGMLIFELLEGRPLRQNISYADILGSLIGGGELRIQFNRTDISAVLKRVVAKCLAIDPIDRYASASELHKALSACMEGNTSEGKYSKLIRQAITWARNPDRPIQICYYIIPINIVLSVWMLVCCVLGYVMPPGFKVSDVIQCLGISFGLSGTMIFLSYLRICGHVWATIALLALTIAGMVVVPILAILDVIPSFETAYKENRYFDYVNHGQVLLLGIMQCGLLGVSLICDASRKRRNVEADLQRW